jgi:hypothetical protein
MRGLPFLCRSIRDGRGGFGSEVAHHPADLPVGSQSKGEKSLAKVRDGDTLPLDSCGPPIIGLCRAR